MLLQPLLENAIWHGLRYKSAKGRLTLTIAQTSAGEVCIVILDDGVGRARSQALKTKHQTHYRSTGLDNIRERVALLNERFGLAYELTIADAEPDATEPGTLVTLTLAAV